MTKGNQSLKFVIFSNEISLKCFICEFDIFCLFLFRFCIIYTAVVDILVYFSKDLCILNFFARRFSHINCQVIFDALVLKGLK